MRFYILYNSKKYGQEEKPDMRMNAEEKKKLIARYQAGESVAEICSEGVARSTFYTWIKPYTITVTDSGYEANQNEFIKMKQRIHIWNFTTRKGRTACSVTKRLTSLKLFITRSKGRQDNLDMGFKSGYFSFLDSCVQFKAQVKKKGKT